MPTTKLDGHPLDYWHAKLCADGNFSVPCSPYGQDTADCAWYAIACEMIYVDANGFEGDTFENLNYYMGLVVNGSTSVGELILDNWYVLPRSLKQELGYKYDIRKAVFGPW